MWTSGYNYFRVLKYYRDVSTLEYKLIKSNELILCIEAKTERCH